MRLALVLIFIFFISVTGKASQAAISDDSLYDGINSLQRRDNSEIFYNDCRNTQQATIDSHLVTANGYLFDDCMFNTQPEKALLTYDPDGAQRPNHFDDKWTKLAGIANQSLYARAEIPVIDSGRDGELANNPSPGSNYYADVISWIENAYHAWFAKDHYGSTRLLLLSIGLVGLIGIKRKFKKS